MDDKPIPYGRQELSEDDIKAVERCLRGDWLTQGPLVGQFEEGLCSAVGSQYGVAVSSGTAALHLAALAYDIGPGDIGITSAVSFVASANCIEYCGGEVRFVDVDPQTGLLSLESLEAVIDKAVAEGRAPKLIVPVDLAGQPADMAGVKKLADKVGATVVSDAAHSLGGTYEVDGRSYLAGCCAHADAAILSFHPVKNITAGEGGAILTNDFGAFEKLAELRTHGIHKDTSRFMLSEDSPYYGSWYHEQDRLGFNYRLSDIHAALGISQLERLSQFIERRREIAAIYDQALSSAPLIDHLQPLRIEPGRRSAYHLYVVQLSAGAEEPEVAAALRKDLYDFLREKNVLAQVHYIPIPWQPYYRRKYNFSHEDFPGATDYYSRSISLPMYTSMSDAQVSYVIELLCKWVSSRNASN